MRFNGASGTADDGKSLRDLQIREPDRNGQDYRIGETLGPD